MPGKGTTYTNISGKTDTEEIRDLRKLYFGFVDIEKAFGRVPKEITR